MEYPDSETAKEVADRVQNFLDDVVIPREREALAKGEQISNGELEEFWEMAKERDLFAPQVPEEYGDRDWTSVTCSPPSSRSAARLSAPTQSARTRRRKGTCTLSKSPALRSKRGVSPAARPG